MQTIDDNWVVLPKVGMGPIRFGMTREEVAEVAPWLGPVSMTRNLRPDEVGLRKLLVDFPGMFSEEDLKEVLAVSQQVFEANPGWSYDSYNTGAQLDFQDDRLTRIMATPSAKNVHLGEMKLYEAAQLDVVRHFCTQLRETPKIHDSVVLFENACVELVEFAQAVQTDAGLEIVEGDTENYAVSWSDHGMDPRDARFEHMADYAPMPPPYVYVIR